MNFEKINKSILLLCGISLLSACIEKEKIATIPDAENLLITTDQRLLVTGGKSIYQIDQIKTPDNKIAYQTLDLFPPRFLQFCRDGPIRRLGILNLSANKI